MAYAQCKSISHARRVCSAYKKLLRAMAADAPWAQLLVWELDPLKDAKHGGDLHSYYFDTESEEDEHVYLEFPFARELIRREFEKNRNLTDMVKARELVANVDKILHEEFYDWKDDSSAIDDPGGLDYERIQEAPDWIYDTWHPLERQQYPKFFGLRNLRKIEHMERWNAKYGKPEGAPDFSQLKEEFVKLVYAKEPKTSETLEKSS